MNHLKCFGNKLFSKSNLELIEICVATIFFAIEIDVVDLLCESIVGMQVFARQYFKAIEAFFHLSNGTYYILPTGVRYFKNFVSGIRMRRFNARSRSTTNFGPIISEACSADEAVNNSQNSMRLSCVSFILYLDAIFAQYFVFFLNSLY